MITRIAAALILVSCARVYGAYSYYNTGGFGQPDAVTWQANGTLGYGVGLTSTSVGSLIYKPAGPAYYEVAAMLRIPVSGGRYIVFLSASQNARLSDAGAVGTFYAAEIWNPQQLSTGGCSANLYLWKSVNSSLSLLSSSTITCKADTQIRAVVQPGRLTANVNKTFQAWYPENVLSGQPGIGVANIPAGNLDHPGADRKFGHHRAKRRFSREHQQFCLSQRHTASVANAV